MTKTYNVLFLCTANSARSIMAEAILNQIGRGKFRAFSAGSHPAREVNPMALDVLERVKIPTAGLRAKSWDEFARPDAPVMDFVFTVCDKAAGEVCPAWPGQPMTAHWGFPDPVEFRGSEEEQAAVFSQTYRQMVNRIQIFLALPIATLSRLALKREIDRIGLSSVNVTTEKSAS
jgi:arsenate reductase